MTDETAGQVDASVAQTNQVPTTDQTILRHVHDELERLIHAIESGAHNGLEHLKALKETVAKHL